MLASETTRECFKLVPWWHPKVFQCRRLVEIAKFAQSDPLNSWFDAFDTLEPEQRLSLPIRKRCDHAFNSNPNGCLCQENVLEFLGGGASAQLRRDCLLR